MKKIQYFLCSSLLGEMIQFDEHIFQMGWFNHKLEMLWYALPEKLSLHLKIGAAFWNLFSFWVLAYFQGATCWRVTSWREWKGATPSAHLRKHVYIVDGQIH